MMKHEKHEKDNDTPTTLPEVREKLKRSSGGSAWKEVLWFVIGIIAVVLASVTVVFLIDAQGFQSRLIQNSRRNECARQIDAVYDDLTTNVITAAIAGDDAELERVREIFQTLGPKGELIQEVCPSVEDVPDYTELLPDLLDNGIRL